MITWEVFIGRGGGYLAQLLLPHMQRCPHDVALMRAVCITWRAVVAEKWERLKASCILRVIPATGRTVSIFDGGDQRQFAAAALRFVFKYKGELATKILCAFMQENVYFLQHATEKPEDFVYTIRSTYSDREIMHFHVDTNGTVTFCYGGLIFRHYGYRIMGDEISVSEFLEPYAQQFRPERAAPLGVGEKRRKILNKMFS